MKNCRVCRKDKPLDQFDLHRTRKTPIATCIECLEKRLKAMTQKHCNKCDVTLPIDKFRIDSQRRLPRIHCIDCESVVKKRWHQNNQESHTENMRRKRLASYGLTEEQIDMVKDIKECQVCGRSEGLVIDHCHDQLKYRGVLCHQCNVGIGMANNSPETLRALANYLESHILNVQNVSM